MTAASHPERSLARRLVRLLLVFALACASPPPAFYEAWAQTASRPAVRLPAGSYAALVSNVLRASLPSGPAGAEPASMDVPLLDGEGPTAGEFNEKIRLFLELYPALPETASSGTEIVGGARRLSPEESKETLRTFGRVLQKFSPAQLRDPETLETAAQDVWRRLDLRVLSAAGPPPSLKYEFSPERWAYVLRERRPRADPKTWLERRPEILAQASRLREELERVAKKREEEIGSAALDQEIDQDKVVASVPELGKAELSSIDGARVVRVTHAPTELSVLFLDRSAVRAGSGHLRQYIARQHMDAGRTRQDGQNGRDLAIVWEQYGKAVSDQYLPRRRPAGRGWWADWWRATAKKPNLEDWILGAYFGALQAALAFALIFMQALPGSLAGHASIPAALTRALGRMDYTPIVFTGIFGLVVGTLSSSYYNWTYRGSQLAQFIKTSMVSFLFAYSMIAFTHGVSSLNPLALSSWVLHLHVWSNVFLNNLGKVAWQQLGKIGRDNRMFQKPLVLFGLKVSRTNFVNQHLYLVNWTFRLVDLIGLPLGKWIFAASIPLARRLVLRYAERNGLREAAAMRERWERDKSLLAGLFRRPLSGPQKLAGWIGKFFRAPGYEIPEPLIRRFPDLGRRRLGS